LSKLDAVWNRGQGKEAFLSELSSPFSDLHCQGQPAGDKLKQGKINMKLQNLIHILIGIVCIGLLPRAQAVVPPPDGGYSGFTTAEGTQALQSLTTGAGNTGVGFRALFADTTGSFNTGLGAGTLVLNQADSNTAVGALALLLNTTGFQNTAVGTAALLNNTIGNGNTATGNNALFSNTEGNFNTAIGGAALVSNTTGAGNTATGTLALDANTTGSLNTATGFAALQSNTTGGNNTAMGAGALNFNTLGHENTAIGQIALQNNTEGAFNTATGQGALASNTIGVNNTASGAGALFLNNTGGSNTAIGFQALNNNTVGGSNTVIGHGAMFNNLTGSNNTAIGNVALHNSHTSGSIGRGFQAGLNVTNASNVICIGNFGADVSDSCFIGNIRGVATHMADAIPVVIDSLGQLGTQSSSNRFKKDIKPMDGTSNSILELKPVTFHYNGDIKDTPQFGLIAEEVEKINPNLVVRDKEGKPYTVRYDAVNAMLLNEFLKEHKKTEQLEATVAGLVATVKEQATQIQKVSAQLEASKPAPQMVNNP